jgi:hypothetical protein
MTMARIDAGLVADDGGRRPDPEAPERARRRTFTAAYKQEVLAAYRHRRNEVIGTAGGSRRALPGPAAAGPPYSSWPPTGVIAPDSSTAAAAESGRHGRLTVHLINLRTGTTIDLGVPLGLPGSNFPSGPDAHSQSMAWSPDSRWLFVAAAGGRLIAVSTRTGRAESLGVALPAVDQVAIRA